MVSYWSGASKTIASPGTMQKYQNGKKIDGAEAGRRRDEARSNQLSPPLKTK
jgi:hypothetical protein